MKNLCNMSNKVCVCAASYGCVAVIVPRSCNINMLENSSLLLSNLGE